MGRKKKEGSNRPGLGGCGVACSGFNSLTSLRLRELHSLVILSDTDFKRAAMVAMLDSWQRQWCNFLGNDVRKGVNGDQGKQGRIAVCGNGGGGIGASLDFQITIQLKILL